MYVSLPTSLTKRCDNVPCPVCRSPSTDNSVYLERNVRSHYAVWILCILHTNSNLSLSEDFNRTAEFCTATVETIRTERWIGYEVVKNAWASIPIDCAEILDHEYDDMLPPK